MAGIFCGVVPLPKVTIKNGCVYLARPNMPPGHDYEIDLDRLQTPRDLVGWIYQIIPKTWADEWLVKEFIDVVCAHRGWSQYV